VGQGQPRSIEAAGEAQAFSNFSISANPHSIGGDYGTDCANPAISSINNQENIMMDCDSPPLGGT
jgi:hypothetical protein